MKKEKRTIDDKGEPMQSIFTYIIDYDGGIFIHQNEAISVKHSILRWAKEYDFSSQMKIKDNNIIRRDFKYEKFEPTPVDTVTNVWC
ncbi:MAG: hypothetical protein AB1921_09565 [Thermodesulfobacteriota bacterium]